MYVIAINEKWGYELEKNNEEYMGDGRRKEKGEI